MRRTRLRRRRRSWVGRRRRREKTSEVRRCGGEEASIRWRDWPASSVHR